LTSLAISPQAKGQLSLLT